MRICHNCQARNRDSNKLCSECQAFIRNDAVEPDMQMMDMVMKRENRRRLTRKITIFTICGLYFLIFSCYFAYICYDMFGSLYHFWKLQVWYIPCLIIFIFPYNRVYQLILRKRGKPPKPLSDFVFMGFMVVGAIYMTIMYQMSYDIWNILARTYDIAMPH